MALKFSMRINKGRNNLFLQLCQIQPGFAAAFAGDTDLHNHFNFLPIPSHDSPAVTLDSAKTDSGFLICPHFLHCKGKKKSLIS